MARPREYEDEVLNKVSAQLNAAQREMYTRLGRARWLRRVLDAEILSNPNSVLNMTEKD